MKTKLFSFQDGLRLVHVKMEGVRSVAIGILTGAGSANESADNNGISHLIEHMLFKGTKTRTSYDIVKEVDALGAQINAYTTKQATCFYTIGLDEASDKCCEILSDLLFESVFDPEELEREKKVVLEEISMSEDDYGDVCSDIAAAGYFGSSPLGMPILGTRDNVKKFGREDLISYIAANYRASTTVIAIAGNIDFDRAKALAERYFVGRFAKGEREWKDAPRAGAPVQNYRFKDIEQSHIIVTMPSVKYNAGNDLAVMLLNQILGGGMSSRLFFEIREKLGLAYNVYSYQGTYVGNGTLNVYIGTNRDSVAKAADVAAEVIADIRKNGLTREEFERGVQQLRGAYLLGQESSGSIMRLFAKHALYADELFDFDERIKRIYALDYDGVSRAIEGELDLSAACVAYVGREVDKDLSERFLSRA